MVGIFKDSVINVFIGEKELKSSYIINSVILKKSQYGTLILLLNSGKNGIRYSF